MVVTKIEFVESFGQGDSIIIAVIAYEKKSSCLCKVLSRRGDSLNTARFGTVPKL
jgi:hypothetical protein